MSATYPPIDPTDPWDPELWSDNWPSDEPEMESSAHAMTMMSLIGTLHWHWRDRRDFFACGNFTVYFNPEQRKSIDFRGPDFFVVLDTEHASIKPRKSWVVWQERGKYPNVIFELLSDSTAANDRGVKMQVYQDIFRTPQYFLFDPHAGALEGFTLEGGHYEPITPDSSGLLACPELGLMFGVREGELRMFTAEGVLIATAHEAAEQAIDGLATEHQRAEAERQRADAAEAELARFRRGSTD